MVLKGKHDLPTMSPYVRIAHQALGQMRALLVEFGMTPSARARIRVPETAKPPVGKWAGLL
jgi:phage terminase small subunit